MDYELIFSGKATLEDLCELNKLGYSFVIEGGHITAVVKPQQDGQ